MSIGGGEILRGVMEKNSVYSSPALYCIPLNARDGTGAATLTQTAFLQLHKTAWFLATSLFPTATNDPRFERISDPEFIRLFDPADTTNYVLVPIENQATMFGDATLNNPFVLPTYMLWEPGSLIGLEWTGVNHATTDFKFLTLLGIEYGMKGL